MKNLSECFDHLLELAPHLAYKPEVELAMWFHDAVYDTHRTDNDTFSTQLFRSRYEEQARANLMESVPRLINSP